MLRKYNRVMVLCFLLGVGIWTTELAQTSTPFYALFLI